MTLSRRFLPLGLALAVLSCHTTQGLKPIVAPDSAVPCPAGHGTAESGATIGFKPCVVWQERTARASPSGRNRLERVITRSLSRAPASLRLAAAVPRFPAPVRSREVRRLRRELLDQLRG